VQFELFYAITLPGSVILQPESTEEVGEDKLCKQKSDIKRTKTTSKIYWAL